ncbi:MAG: hypothetical protein Q4Q17_01130 [Tissierellia bacterium]|nr:hypothetical protein [Tissierellia bacterium]
MQSLGVDYLDYESESASIAEIPGSREVLVRYVDGEEHVATNWAIYLRLPYTEDVNDGLQNHNLTHGICSWINEQNKERNYPNDRVLAVEAIGEGYYVSSETNTCVYQVTIKISYRGGNDG